MNRRKLAGQLHEASQFPGWIVGSTQSSDLLGVIHYAQDAAVVLEGLRKALYDMSAHPVHREDGWEPDISADEVVTVLTWWKTMRERQNWERPQWSSFDEVQRSYRQEKNG